MTRLLERDASLSRSPPLRGRCPAGQRGVGTTSAGSRGRPSSLGRFDDGEYMPADSFNVANNVIIPEPDNLPSRRLEASRAGSVTFGARHFSMLRSVDLDHQPVRRTGEINDVAGDRHLSAKAEVHQSVRPDGVPKTQLGLRHGAAHLPGAGAMPRWDRAMRHRFSPLIRTTTDSTAASALVTPLCLPASPPQGGRSATLFAAQGMPT